MKFSALIISLFLSAGIQAGELLGDVSFGDSKDTVLNKLLKNKTVSTTTPKSMFQRLGMDGAFTTKKNLKGLKFSLYFEWTDSGSLKEINYRSAGLPRHSYKSSLKEKWSYAINLLSAIHGRPMNAGFYPKKSDLASGKIQYSHEWRTRSGFVYLGTGKLKNEYNLNITFTRFILPRQN